MHRPHAETGESFFNQEASGSISSIFVALTLMREALTLLDEPEEKPITQHLRLAIEAAEKAPFEGGDRSPAATDNQP